MFQFETAKPSHPPTALAPTGPRGAVLSHRALLVWSEHCIECAPPACYQSCDLFEATPALKCRRFVDGIVANRHLAGPAAGEIRFRRWAKLEAQGNAAMLPAAVVDRYEAILDRLNVPIVRLGAAAHRLGGGSRWLTAAEALHKRINRKLAGRSARSSPPDLFVAEITNPGGAAVQLILTVMVDKLRLGRTLRSDQLPPPAILRLDVPPGFSAHELDVAPMRAILDSGLPFNLAISPESDATTHLVFHRLDLGISADRSTVAKEDGAQAPLKAAKLVIFDLDNTLWRGILLEGEVTPLPGLAALFRMLDERGILLSVASKNAPEDALRRLEEAGLADYLLYPQIGWLPKSEGIQRIVKAIDIGADTVIFVDDNPFERAEVQATVAGVEVLPETAIATLADHPRLQGASTPEARGRRRMYQEAVQREEAASGYGDDYISFLRSCEITTAIRPDRPEDFERIAELVQRTNQLNFSGRKYSRDDTAAILASPDVERHVISCTDRFGSYGTVGFCLVHREPSKSGADELVIDDFMLSCRVQGKFIEQALLHHLVEKGPRPVDSVRVNFRPTDRNQAARMVLEKLGLEADEAASAYRKSYVPGEFTTDFITIETD